MGLQLITPPAVEPVTLGEMNIQLGLGPMESADQLQEQQIAEKVRPAIVAARQRCESICARAFITQTWEMKLQNFPYWHIDYKIPHRLDIQIPLPTFQTLDAFTYIDVGGVSQDMMATGGWGYQLVEGADTRPARLRPPIGRLWPVTLIEQADAVTIRFTCGFGDTASSLPYSVRNAVKILTEWYYNGAKGLEPEAVHALLAPYIVEVV